jgi:hypothetical protein
VAIHFFDPVMGVNRTIGAGPGAVRKPLLVPLGLDRVRSTSNHVQPKPSRISAPLAPLVDEGCTWPKGCTNPRLPRTGAQGRPPTRCALHVSVRKRATRPMLAPRCW